MRKHDEFEKWLREEIEFAKKARRRLTKWERTQYTIRIANFTETETKHKELCGGELND